MEEDVPSSNPEVHKEQQQRQHGEEKESSLTENEEFSAAAFVDLDEKSNKTLVGGDEEDEKIAVVASSSSCDGHNIVTPPKQPGNSNVDLDGPTTKSLSGLLDENRASLQGNNDSSARRRAECAVAVQSSMLLESSGTQSRREGIVESTSSQTSALPTIATVLSQPEAVYEEDNDAHHWKDEERQYRDSPAVTRVPGTTVLADTNYVGDSTVEQVETDISDVVERGEAASNGASETNNSTLPTSETSPIQTNLQYQTLVTATPIQALMVAEAVQVTIDGEGGESGGEIGVYEQECSTELASKGEKMPYLCKDASGRIHFLGCLLAILLIIGMVLAIALPLTSKSKSSVQSRSNDATFDYPCYRNTLQILVDQLEDVNHVNDTYALCPNTTIQVGTILWPILKPICIILCRGITPFGLFTHQSLCSAVWTEEMKTIVP